MWARLGQVALNGRIRHARVRATASVILLVRWLEGAAACVIVDRFFSGSTVDEWIIHLNFAAYGLINLLLFFPQRREALSPRLLWFDILGNLLPMAAAAHWSGGIYSPLLPIFVVKISSYGLVYGVDAGVQSLAATTLIAIGLVVIDAVGLAPTPSIDAVPLLVRQRLGLGFEGLTFGILVGGSLRFFRLLDERDARLHLLVSEKERLYEESLWHQRQLQELSRRMMQASEDTMRRLVRELHDDLGQALTAVRIDLGLVDRELPPESPSRLHVREAREQIATVMQSLRNLSQLLRPPVLDDLGLVPAMQWYTSRFAERTGIAVTLETGSADTRLQRSVEIALYRVLQEALTNVSRHAEAQHVSIQLAIADDRVSLQIADDGRGFDAAGGAHNRPTDRGMGVLGMRERVATYGGHFSIASRPGAGTAVELTIPLSAALGTKEEGHGQNSRLAS